MENASKALIIAGAILIAILLISVGIIVMNSINDPIDEATDSAASQAIEIFNSKFTGYLGSGQKASSVKSLMTAIASSNGANPEHKIDVNGIGTTTGAIQSAVVNKNTYTCEASYGTDGYINAITVTLDSATEDED